MGFELPRVTMCCFCFSLRTGALLIGYLSMISALASLASTSTFIYLVSRYVSQNSAHPPPGHSAADVQSNAVRLYIVHGLQLLGFLFYFVISLLLVIGAHKRQPRYMRHYFLAGAVNLVFNLAVVTVSFLYTGFFATVSQLMGCAILFYFLLVVRSAFLELEEAARPKVYELTQYQPTPAQYQPGHAPLMA